MPTEEKVTAVSELAELMKASKGIYLADFTGIDVPTFTQLRRKLSDESVNFRVIKNRLALLAVKEAGVEGLDDMFAGMTGLATSEEDAVTPARVIAEFADKADGRPRIKAGYIDGTVYVEAQLETLARLPSREVLLSQMVSAVQSPISGLAFCLGGILQKLVGTLDAVRAQKEEDA
jgi:large subunit ribosomal protein L10